jgi:transcription antitermination factor NusA-like protein
MARNSYACLCRQAPEAAEQIMEQTTDQVLANESSIDRIARNPQQGKRLRLGDVMLTL